MFLTKNLKCFQLPMQILRSRNAKLSSSSNLTPAKTVDLNAVVGTESFGQPTASTHPHLIKKNDLVPGITVAEFQERRARFMKGIQRHEQDNIKSSTNVKSHLVIIPSSTKKYMSDKIPYIFRQNSDFYYLTGCLEPDTVLMMHVDKLGEVKSTLFMRPKDKHAELWDGPRTGVDQALDLFAVDEAYASDQFSWELNRRLSVGKNKPILWYNAANSDLPQTTKNVQQAAGGSTKLLSSPTEFVQSMRLFKSPAEQDLMRRTCEIASTAINEVIHDARPGHSEHHIYAMIDYRCRMRNANHLAYPPVVASGNNGTTIHYINNSQLTKSGDLILMDAGCEYAGYTSDITRTWPIGGSFSEPQKVIYDVVELLQKEMIDTLLKEGGITLDQLFDTMCIRLGKYLQEVGIVPKDIYGDQAYAKAGYQFCPHHVSHYLGMDVHDTPLMPRALPLLPGMICTVEPGVYIGHDRTDVPKEFRGIGVRIEDDILITSENKVEVLTAKCTKSRTELENISKNKSSYTNY